MDSSERRARIRANLGIEPISHGQVYTFQIAISALEQQNISLERRQLIEETLTQHKSNLIPLIVRRTEAYSEEEEYEVVYGADWCLVAKELDIEKLWVWVFDMNDEQAAAAKDEMQQLLGYSIDGENSVKGETDISSLIDQKLKPIYTKINQLLSNSLANTEKSDSEGKLRAIESRLENISSALETLTVLVKEIVPPLKLNLVIANEEEIKSALEEGGATKNQINAAWEAIKYWKQSGKVLTWQNLKKSSESGSEHKIKNFAKATYEKVKKFTDIRNS
ncbi:hypothetical protein [Nostoc sp. 'Peltigera membranacea cyanobiont' N6]|uniref:hypothetical protein n=1 Tax=Nostoc sp. 'Peltigera membranacea cyanobiont' N6 TaxID=1261031 RepID=UPI000CF354F9|nr:hypothetical protein [Nostoc sp. 'Peltigera membranacea cyanobiont' N6]AVH66884.1 hypothetical protein NPM_5447 [Nostoc sp. 'Peltigera membranacea cyanobiont' N6]